MTAQIAETLILNGKRRSMQFCPPLPPDSSKPILNVHHENQDTVGADGVRHLACVARWVDAQGVEHIEDDDLFCFTTACWRQYVGTWEIKKGGFYLVALRGRLRLAERKPLYADWFTGVLRVPLGRELVYVHMGFGSVFEKELHIMVERGKVMGRRIYDNRGKDHDRVRLGWRNLPGLENRFPGDRDFN